MDKYMALSATFELDENFDNDKFIKMRAKIMHSKVNPNRSNFDRIAIDKAQASLANSPVLGNVVFDENEEPDFSGHDMHIEEDRVNEGEFRVIYDEQPIGIIPESCNYSVENIDGLDYVFADMYIFKEYSNYAQDIIERDKDVKLSMEIIIDEYKFNNTTGISDILKYRYKGITLLGKDLGTGMRGAKATMYSDDSKERYFELVDELKSILNTKCDNIDNNFNNGGLGILDKKLELLKKYQIDVENLNFDIDSLTLEEFETKVKEFIQLKENPETEKKFSLNLMEKMDEIINILSEQKFTHEYWGEMGKYWFVDIQNDECICMDVSDKFHLYGIKINENGDAVELDFAGCKRKKTTYEDFVDTSETGFLYAEKSIEDAFRFVQNRFETLKSEFNSYKVDYSVKNDEFEELKQFRLEKMEEQHKLEVNNILDNFSDLEGVVEFKTLKENAFQFEDVKELEKECFVIRGKNVKTTPSSKNEKPQVKFTLEVDNESYDPYGGIITKYNKK